MKNQQVLQKLMILMRMELVSMFDISFQHKMVRPQERLHNVNADLVKENHDASEVKSPLNV